MPRLLANPSSPGLMSALNVAGLKSAKASEALTAMEDAERNLVTISQRMQSLASKANSQQPPASRPADWTSIYSQCAEWQELEDLKERQQKEQKTIDSITNHQEMMGHYHDHSKEKEFFDLPEDEKIRQCHSNKDVGNYLFYEGNYERALDRYQTAICYYEYCFPDKDEEQAELDTFRHACLSNLALCQIHLGFYRAAIDSADRVLIENDQHAKAYFRKAQAHRHLDEYELALQALAKAAALEPQDSALRDEQRLIKQLQRGYLHMQQQVAQRILSDSRDHDETTQPAEEAPYEHILDTSRGLEPLVPLDVQRYHIRMSQAVKPADRW